MDVSNSTAAAAVKALTVDKVNDGSKLAGNSGFGQIMKDMARAAADTTPVSDPLSPNAPKETRVTVGHPAPVDDAKHSGRTTIAEPVAISGTGRLTISEPARITEKTQTRTTIADTSPFDINAKTSTRTTIADTSPFDLNAKTSARTTIAEPVEIAPSGMGRMTVSEPADLATTAKPQTAQSAMERSLSLFLAGQLEAATSKINGLEALRTSDS